MKSSAYKKACTVKGPGKHVSEGRTGRLSHILLYKKGNGNTVGVEGLNEFASGPVSGTDEETETVRPTDQEVHDRHEAEKAAEREEHNRRRVSGEK